MIQDFLSPFNFLNNFSLRVRRLLLQYLGLQSFVRILIQFGFVAGFVGGGPKAPEPGRRYAAESDEALNFKPIGQSAPRISGNRRVNRHCRIAPALPSAPSRTKC